LLALALAGPPLASPALAQDAAPATAQAEDAAPSSDQPDDIDEIVVTATRLRGQVQTDSPPVLELEEEDIAAYGATSIADLVEQLAPQTGSGRGRGGRPVFLVNGQRVSGFREFSRFPPEAIRKVEVLPEEVALKFGYPPDARVINFILKENFASKTAEVEFGMPIRGGNSTAEAEASILTIDGPRRVNGSLEYARTSPLTESERDVVQSITTPAEVAAAGLDPADFRTLVSRRESVTANATVTQGLGDMGSGGQLTLNGEIGRVVTDSLSGIDPIDLEPIQRRTATDSYSLGGSYNRALGAWQFSNTLDANRTDSDSQIDVRGGSGTDRSLSRTYTADFKSTLAGSPFTLPAGEANLTLDAGYKWNRIDSTDTRSAGQEISLDRSRARAGASLNLPVTSTREGFLDAIGDLSLNLGGGIDHLSDFGTLTDWNVGANWKPTERLGLQSSYIVRKVAPSLTQLGGPQIVDVNVPVYDFTTGQTVLASVITGGNPNLLAETQRDLKVSASYDLDLFERANIRVEYFRNNSRNTTESFPLLTPAVEAAFPGRVTRGADGTLLAIDRRPVTFAERSSSRIRYGFNVFGKFGEPAPEGAGGGGGGRGGFRGMMAAAAPAPAPGSEPAPGSGPAAPGASPAGGQFDPARFAELRTRFCAVPDGQTPDLTGLPERMLERLKGADGQIDPAKVAAMKQRFCAADGARTGLRSFDPARIAALRTALACGIDGKEPDLATLPPEVAERLKGPDGQIDMARLAQLRTRVCAMDPAQLGQRGGTQGGAPAGERGNRQGGGGAPGGRAGGGGGGFGGAGGGGDGQGRWNLSLFHTIELNNRALIAAGGPELDLLDGDALGESGVGRHKVELEGGLFKDGIGLRMSANYLSGSTVRGSGLPGSSDLEFGDLATFNLRLFANLEQQKWLTGAGEPGFWKGARLSLRVDNLFDAQQRVTDSTGTVPLRYQPGLIDPTGRFVQIEFRKLF
jgi:outer membrane receptor protein involved in Fe transport